MSWLSNIFPCLKPNVVEPDRPNHLEVEPPKLKYEIPQIEVLPIRVATQGKYKTKTGKARGVLIHTTAGRSLKGRSDAVATLKYMADNGLGCIVMDKDGKLYRAENQDLDTVAWHAGNSKFQDVTGLSQYLIGLEICCAGKLVDKNTAWFGEKYPDDQVRHIPTKKDNIWPGYYHKMTNAQEESLINFCLWQLSENPEFRLSWILSHDQVCVPAGRKTDCGGSLSYTIPEFQAMLAKK